MLKTTFLSAIAGLAVGSLFGAEPIAVKPHTPQILHAGPIEVKFEDGELRYWRVGDKEIVRRLYFAVRNKSWATPMPEFSKIDLENGGDSFRIQLAAHCKSSDADYEWTGTITGTKDGKIVFDAEGTPNIDFGSGRIGLCTLFGTESLVGQSFEALNEKGEATAGAFPEFVSPGLVAKQFQTLRYTTSTGMKVSCKLEGSTFDMEDQRNWGDTSFKAYAPLKYSYPTAKKGQHEHETITIEVSGAPDVKAPAPESVEVRVGKKPIEGAKVPAMATGAQKSIGFVDANMHRPKFAESTALSFLYTPFNHLPDDDTMMENLRAVWHQARTSKQFAPKATLRFAPIGLQSATDERTGKAIAAAWTAGMIKYLSLGGADEMGFVVGPGPVDEVIKHFTASAGKALLETEVKPAVPGIEAFAIDDPNGRVLWLINTSPEKRQVRVEETGAPDKVTLQRIIGEGTPEKTENIADGHVSLTLLPYEVCRVQLGN